MFLKMFFMMLVVMMMVLLIIVLNSNYADVDADNHEDDIFCENEELDGDDRNRDCDVNDIYVDACDSSADNDETIRTILWL